jgi:hypothetical protein
MNDRKSDKSDAPTVPPPPKTEASEEVTRAGEIPPEIMALLAAKGAAPTAGAPHAQGNDAKTVPPPANPAAHPPAPRPAAGAGPALASSMVDVDDDDGWGTEKAPGSGPGSGPAVNQSMKTPQAFEVYKPRVPQYDTATPAIPFPPSAPPMPAAAPAPPPFVPPPAGHQAAPPSKTDPLPPAGQSAAVAAPMPIIPKTPGVPQELAFAPPESPMALGATASTPPAPQRRFDVKFAFAAFLVVGILAAVAVWALK